MTAVIGDDEENGGRNGEFVRDSGMEYFAVSMSLSILVRLLIFCGAALLIVLVIIACSAYSGGELEPPIVLKSFFYLYTQLQTSFQYTAPENPTQST